jgi:hypothetical protein
MRRTVTLPAWGERVRLRRSNQIAPQASRQCSCRGRSGGGRWSGPSRHLRGGARLIRYAHPFGAAFGSLSHFVRLSQTPAHAAPVQPLPWLCRRPPVGSSLCRFASAAAADPSASLQGGLVREAAVGRARAECRLRREFIGCPILASLFERAEGWLQGSSKVIGDSDAP